MPRTGIDRLSTLRVQHLVGGRPAYLPIHPQILPAFRNVEENLTPSPFNPGSSNPYGATFLRPLPFHVRTLKFATFPPGPPVLADSHCLRFAEGESTID